MRSTKMGIDSKKKFSYIIGEADEAIKEDFYDRLCDIEKGFEDKTLAATSNTSAYDRQSIAGLLKGIVLNAPPRDFYDDEDLFHIGSISLPSDLCDFLATYCKGSTDIAYKILNEVKMKVKGFPEEQKRKYLTNLRPIVYLMGLVDERYQHHIGSNSKYLNRKIKTADVNQLIHSKTVPVWDFEEDKKEVKNLEVLENSFLEYFNDLFKKESRPKSAYEPIDLLNNHCQYCHRPHLARKKFCFTHAFDKNGNNPKAKSITNAFQNAFRNLGLLLHDEYGFIQTNPENYIKLAKAKRETEAKRAGNLRVVQNELKSEYFRGLQKWTKFHPDCKNFSDELYECYRKYQNCLNDVHWTGPDCLKLISGILKISIQSSYILDKYTLNISDVAQENLKSSLLGSSGLDIKIELHEDITVGTWILMLIRLFNYQLIFTCKSKINAARLAYKT